MSHRRRDKSLSGNKPLQPGNKLLPRDHAGAEGFEVFRINLTIDELDPLFPQLLNISDKSVLAGIAGLAEHTFTKKYLTHPDPI